MKIVFSEELEIDTKLKCGGIRYFSVPAMCSFSIDSSADCILVTLVHFFQLRKYVSYRWSCKALDEGDNYKNGTNCTDCLHRSGSLHSSKSSQKRHRMATTSFNRKINLSSKEVNQLICHDQLHSFPWRTFFLCCLGFSKNT